MIRGAVHPVDLDDAKRGHDGEPVYHLGRDELAEVEHAVTLYLGL
ncbi:hypothetical protein [Nonomuraea antri]|nr:hypothetical protein [Nonomuraea antri]